MGGEIDVAIEKLLAENQIAGCSLIVRRREGIVYNKNYGYSNLGTKEETNEKSIYRIMSMSKVLTVAVVLKLIEDKKIGLYDEVQEYIPSLKKRRVVYDERFINVDLKDIKNTLLTLSLIGEDVIQTKPCREITVFDLLTHSSGIEQGLYGLLKLLKKPSMSSLDADIAYYSDIFLDFAPGEGTGYSPIAGVNILGKIAEILTHKNIYDLIKEYVLRPLGMADTFFYPDEEQEKRIVHVYKREGERLMDVTGTVTDMDEILKREGKGYYCCSGGMYSTAADYDKFAGALLGGGRLNGVKLLSEKTVNNVNGILGKLPFDGIGGYYWGLGMMVRVNKEKGKFALAEGAFGWSGAYGTHFFVSPKDNLSCVFMTNRADLGGFDSFINPIIEKLVVEQFGEQT